MYDLGTIHVKIKFQYGTWKLSYIRIFKFILYLLYFTNVSFRNLPRRTSFREASAAFRGLNPVRFLMNNYHRKLLHKNAKKKRNSIVSTILDFLVLGSRSKAMDNWTMGFPQAKSPMCLVECVEDGTKFIFIQEVLHNLACPSQILTLQSSNQKQNWKRYVHVSQIGPDEIHVRRCHLPNPPLATPHSANSSMATSD